MSSPQRTGRSRDNMGRYTSFNLDKEAAEKLRATGPNEFVCDECRKRCTRSPTGEIEYGHAHEHDDVLGDERCPNRPAPEEVDSQRRGRPCL